jgi:hypothetical protein
MRQDACFAGWNAVGIGRLFWIETRSGALQGRPRGQIILPSHADVRWHPQTGKKMKKALLLPVLLLLASGTALASDASSILACRALADSAARLSCYDAIPAETAVAPKTAAAKTPEQSFGMETVKKQPDQEQPKSIESTVAGDFDGWGPGSQIRLANGQVWRVIDGSEAVLPRTHNPKARIERNMFGTLFLSVEGSNNSAKVRRVQ